MRILVVDDEYVIVKRMGRQLQKAGYHTVCLQDSQRAIEFFNQNHDHLDLAILDIDMPGTTGIEMAHKISGMRPTFPVILITGILDDTRAKTGQNIKRILCKPVPREDLLDAVRQSLYV
ncbi:MAG TPA: hypothetical protein DCR97_04425 [Deltaproteobacteria bacterium]|jgi:CheY-like chemotaxis protein|nr:hypothetical protein [Deltaproteobacteria bacterium]